jgi:hypothetical protein
LHCFLFNSRYKRTFVQERETIMRHEVQKARERKAQLEAKLTKIENSMYGGLARLPGAAGLTTTVTDDS